MRKYLGCTTSAIGAIAIPACAVVSIFFGLSMLAVEISVASVFLLALCLACSVSCICVAWKLRNLFYSWGKFTENAVHVFVPFQKRFAMEYQKCRGCGIGMYRDAYMNSPDTIFASNVYFIFLSIDPFPEKYRTQINRWRPSQTQIKVQFSEKLYSYLMTVLPPRQATMLKCDYKRYREHKGK